LDTHPEVIQVEIALVFTELGLDVVFADFAFLEELYVAANVLVVEDFLEDGAVAGDQLEEGGLAVITDLVSERDDSVAAGFARQRGVEGPAWIVRGSRADHGHDGENSFVSVPEIDLMLSRNRENQGKEQDNERECPAFNHDSSSKRRIVS
jgi:hypothetical protein